MKNNNLKKSVIRIAFSNIITILSGILVGFIIPKIMGPNNYGIYKIYSLYLTYIGLFNIGFVEGIYIKYGGIDYKNLNKEKFRMYTKFLFYIQVIFTVLLFFISFIFFKNTYTIIFMLLALSIITKIMTSYFQFVSQLSSRFNELAFRNVINALLTIISVIVLFVLWKLNIYETLYYYVYIFVLIFIQFVLTFWYVLTYKDIVFGKSVSIKENYKEIIELIKLGLPLLIANIVGTLILSMDRQFVSVLFDNSTYGIYSFAYNIIGLITTAISAISTVLYPSLKKKDKSKIIDSYYKLSMYIMIILFGLMSGYYLLIPFINWFLIDYAYSVSILRIIFPILIFQSLVTIVIHNFFKAFEKTKLIFYQSIFILVISFLLNLFSYLLFKSVESISIASIITVFIWYMISEYSLLKIEKNKNIKNNAYLVLMLLNYSINLFDIFYLEMIRYLLFYFIVTILFYFNDINIKKHKN